MSLGLIGYQIACCSTSTQALPKGLVYVTYTVHYLTANHYKTIGNVRNEQLPSALEIYGIIYVLFTFFCTCKVS